MSTEPLLLAGAVLILAGALLSITSTRFGVPSLVLFLFLGMAAGSEGIGGIEFDDTALAQQYGVVALAFILFAGGLGTEWSRIRPVLAPGVALASVGVALSAGLLGGMATLVLDLSLTQGMLLGAIIASTDAAAVFSILRSRGVAVRPRLTSLLELESGSNDPAAVFLTVAVIGVIQSDGTGPIGVVGLFVLQMVVGAAAGWALARGAAWVINTVRLEYDGLYPVITIAFVLFTFEGVSTIGGSGFLAAYVAGVTLADTEFLHKRSLTLFHDAIAWLMQISMFVLLGLLVFPSNLGPVALPGLAVAAMLMFVARPLATVVTLLPFRVPRREVAFVSWVGLRGATPIILATFPVVEGIDGADTIFDVVFFVVLASVLVQGSTIPRAARLTGVAAAERRDHVLATEITLTGEAGHDLHDVEVPEGSRAAGVSLVALHLPPGALIVLLHRGDDTLVPEGRTILRAGDRLTVFADAERLAAVRRLVGPR